MANVGNEVSSCVNCAYEKRQRDKAKKEMREAEERIVDVMRYKDGQIECLEDELSKYKNILQGFKLFLEGVEEMEYY